MKHKSKNVVTQALLLIASSAALAGGIVGAIATFPGTVSGGQSAHAFNLGLGWKASLDAGLEEAKDKKKYVLADVYTDWCGWCKKLDKDTFQDEQMVKYLKGKFVCVKLNAEGSKEGRAAAKKYHVHGFPCSLVFNTEGKFIGRLSGYMEPDKFQSALEDLIANPTASSEDSDK
ncbi:hypothetical protein BH11CYA1_BH11CYA1_44550 [soil metagenome]